MTYTEQQVDSILAENERRWVRLNADYDPITGKGAPDERVLLAISDYAIPEQYVPKMMMNNKFIKALNKAGSIEAFLKKHPNDPKYQTAHDIELLIRKIRHRYDFLHWAYFCILISPKKRTKGMKLINGKVRFKLNYPQQLVFLQCEKLRMEGASIDLIILKARQWGGSTFCFFYQLWLMFKWDHSHSFTIAAHVGTASATILGMLQETIKSYPAWDLGLPEGETLHLGLDVGQSAHVYVIKDSCNNAVLPGKIFIGSAEKPESLRSKDISGAHYSEVGIWPDTPKKGAKDLVADIQGGLLEENPYTMQVMESTAKSSDDFFHDTWIECTKGTGGYHPIFIPWFYVPHDTRTIANAREFVKWLLENSDNPDRSGKWKDSGKHYWWLWELGATLEGINWYRYKRLKQLAYSQMQNEAPSTWEEAFVAAGHKVFDPYEVAALRKRCKPYIWEGTLISDAREGVEVLNNIKFIPKQGGDLKIWEMPDDSPVENRYIVAVDIGGPNITSDFSSVRVLDRLLLMDDFNGNPSVVAEMHYHTSHDSLVYDAIRLAHWYNHALLVIESNTLETSDDNRNTGGDGSQYILDVASDIYSNLYTREGNAEDIREGEPKKYGFHTNTKTKPKIIDHLQRCVNDRLWDEPSETCVDEISMYIEDHNKFTAPIGKHDDTLMATAILLWVSYKEMPMPCWRAETSTRINKSNSVATL